MKSEASEILPNLSPETRIARMQALLEAMRRTGFNNPLTMGAFINLYDVHSRRVPVSEHFAFLETLDTPDGAFTEETWNGIVWRRDDLIAGKTPSSAEEVIFTSYEKLTAAN